ncbi:hypothetical protein [Acetobacterium sp.]|uniref:hypothetical protein n=1 Tax=Acetobacterium sp. TaxID=1872094 RepID=UPI0035944C27
MFSSFNVKLSDKIISNSTFYSSGKNTTDQIKEKTHKDLEKYICTNDVLDGNLIESDWFPEINADIFLSHSHADEKLVISLAGWLYEKFGLHTFIDSMVWGYSNNLLKLLDDKYCLNSSKNYSYEKRNISTSHVHMMLSTALSKMIDKCECVFFVNTPNSITVSENIEKNNHTLSPWIYTEIETTRMIRHRKLSEYRNVNSIINESAANFSKEREDLKIRYNIPLEDLIDLTDGDLIEWQKQRQQDICSIPLDKLYEIKDILHFKKV